MVARSHLLGRLFVVVVAVLLCRPTSRLRYGLYRTAPFLSFKRHWPVQTVCGCCGLSCLHACCGRSCLHIARHPVSLGIAGVFWRSRALITHHNYRSEGARHRNGLFHSCACGRVAGVVWLLGSGGRLGFVAPRRAAPLAMGGPVFFEVRFRGWGIHGCVLLTEIYKMSHRTYV